MSEHAKLPDCLRAIKQLRQDNSPRPLTWTDRATTCAYLLLIFACFALAGRVDLQEDERLSLEGYVAAHSTVESAADDLPALPLRDCR